MSILTKPISKGGVIMTEVVYEGIVYILNLSEELFLQIQKEDPEVALIVYDSSNNRKSIIVKFLTVKKKGGEDA